MLVAITEKTTREEQRATTPPEGEERYARIVASGDTIPWQKMRRYLLAQVADEAIPLPTPRKLAGWRILRRTGA
jgi:hypothetical protein